MKKEKADINRALRLSEEIFNIMRDVDNKIGIDDFPELKQTIAENKYAGELLENLSDETYLKASTENLNGEKASTERLQQKVARRKSQAAVRRIAVWGISTAACVVLIVTGFNFMRDRATSDYTLLTPGGSYAILTLADNRTVELNSMSGTTYEQNDSRIFVGEDGIKYVPSASKDMLIHNKLTVPRGGTYFVQLADGTQVWLNAETQLRFPVDFIGDERRVFLSGEAYFAVTEDESKPFIVETELGDIKVYGTEFNIKQYPDQDYIQATLVEGSISFHAEATKETMLTPGYRLSYTSNSAEPVLERVNIQDQIAWKNKQFRFDEQNLYEIMLTLSRWYDMDVVFSSESLKNIELSGILNRSDDVRRLLKLFEETSDVKFIVDGRKVTVMKK